MITTPDVLQRFPNAALTEALHEFVERHRRLFVLTGAGCSTESGIPDYRGLHGEWKRPKPVEFRPFMTDHQVRQRYWARSLIGWQSFGGAAPNPAHHALAALEASGRIGLLVTQNVDGLHARAGSRNVIDLHGRLDRIICMACHHRFPRQGWQEQLATLNPTWERLEATAAPDGDADLDVSGDEPFVVPTCQLCGGIVKPDVVFFGEKVPKWRHAQASAALASADAVLVVGSSLMVYSGYRYAVSAAKLACPIAAVNLGRTRADHLLSIKVEAACGPTLRALTSSIGA